MTGRIHSFSTIRAVQAIIGIWLLMGSCASLRAGDSTQELLNAVARMNAQLGSGETANGWRRHLQLNRLESQAAKGEHADLATLQELHQRLAVAAESAQFQPFNEVRDALENQIRILSVAQTRSIEELLADAAVQYRPIQVEELESRRDILRYDLQQFRQFHQAQPIREKRQAAFDSLRLAELEALLNEVQFEMAPEVSEGKLLSALLELQTKLRAVTAKIDAMPDQEDEEPAPEPETPEPVPGQDPEPRQSQDVDLKSLQEEERALQAQIKELNAKRAAVRREDLPRKRKRADVLKRLFEFEDLFVKAQYDLGDPYAASAQFSLEKFSRLYGFATEDNLQEDYLRRIERLDADLKKLADPSDRRAFGVVGNTLEWLDHTAQVPQLVNAIRYRYSFPNAYIHISGAFLNRIGARPTSEARPICEEINGRQVSGTAYTNGFVNFDIVPDPDQVHLSIRSFNQITSNTQLEQGPLKVFVQTDGQAEARRSLVANIGGLDDDTPYGAANMDSRFCGTSSQCNLVNNVAAKKFGEAKSDADVRAASRVRKEMMQRFSEETTKALADGRESLGRIKSAWLNSFSAMPALYLHSAPHEIRLVGKRHSRWNMGAPGLPSITAAQNDIDIRIHESLLSNYIEPYFRGKTFTSEELAKELKRLMKSDENPLAPRKNRGAAPEDDEPFTITFSNVRPVQLVLEENRLSVVVLATKFTRADRAINAGLNIRLKFRIVDQNGELFLIRDGKAELDYLEGQERNAELVAFRSILNKKLNPEGQELAKTKLPANLLPVEMFPGLKERPATKSLRLSQCRIEGGWFYVGWYHIPDGQVDMRPIDTPAISAQETATISDSRIESNQLQSVSGIQASFGG